MTIAFFFKRRAEMLLKLGLDDLPFNDAATDNNRMCIPLIEKAETKLDKTLAVTGTGKVRPRNKSNSVKVGFFASRYFRNCLIILGRNINRLNSRNLYGFFITNRIFIHRAVHHVLLCRLSNSYLLI